MATPQQTREKWQEILNRGLSPDNFDPETRAKFDEALRRGLITAPKSNAAPVFTQETEVSATPISVQGQDPTPKFTFGEELKGVGETGLALATSAATVPAAGIAGLTTAAIPGGKTGPEGVESVLSKGFQPRSEAGIETLSNVSAPFAAIEEVTTGAGNVALDLTGSPAVATAVKTGLESLPMLLGGRSRGSRTLNDRNVDVASVLEETGNLGLDVGAPIVRQRGQVVDAAKDVAGQTQRAEGFGAVQEALRKARTVEEAYVDNLYFDARKADAEISTSRGTDMMGVIDEALSDRIITNKITPSTRGSLKRLDEIMSGDLDDPVTIRKIMEYRIENNAIRNSKKPDNAALSIINNTVDSFLRAEVTNDLIKGDKTAVAKWQEAFKGTQAFNEIFNTEKVIKDLSTRLDATPETAKQMIMGLNSVNAKTQAGEVVRQIGEIVGKDSPEFGALRQEALFDIVAPLLKEEPNFKMFAENYDKFVRNNKTLWDELSPDSTGEMLTLRRFVSNLERGSRQGLDLNLNQTVARILFGHEIAKGAVRVNLGTNLMNIVRGTAGSSPKQLLISDFTGYDITKPLLPKTPIAIGSTVQAGINQEQQ
tara:strand:+ start:10891 stop:12681 length:1791 start_codon:yes stop_codon:yes gene_type:complete